MAGFGLLAKNDAARTRVYTVRDRLRSNDFFKNPFVCTVKEREKGFFLVSIKPMYPPAWAPALLGCLLLLAILPQGVLLTITKFVTAACLFLSLWWWGPFYFLLFYYATRRGVRYVSPSACIERVV